MYVHSRGHCSILYVTSLSPLRSQSQKKGGKPGASLHAALVICAAAADYKSPEATIPCWMEQRLVFTQAHYLDSLTSGAQAPHMKLSLFTSRISDIFYWKLKQSTYDFHLMKIPTESTTALEKGSKNWKQDSYNVSCLFLYYRNIKRWLLPVAVNWWIRVNWYPLFKTWYVPSCQQLSA